MRYVYCQKEKSYQEIKRGDRKKKLKELEEFNSGLISEQNKQNKQFYILFDFNAIIFWKMQRYGDLKDL